MTVRLAGADRLGTAIAVSQDSWSGQQAQSVVLARWDAFPDALAGTPLAVAKAGPLLLTPSGSLSSSVTTEMKRVLPAGRTVYLLGGATALSAEVAQSVTAQGYKVVRLGGADRYATAVLINRQLGTPTTIFEATGLSFPYALVAGVAAAGTSGAVVLTADRQMPAVTQEYLSAHPDARRVAVGPEAVAADPGATPIAGADRYETPRLLAEAYYPSPAQAAVASGTVFADALSGGAHAGRAGAPLLLSEPSALPPSASRYLTDHAQSLERATLYGGPAALTAGVEDAVRSSIRTAGAAPSPSPSPTAAPVRDTLRVDERLGPDESLWSPNGRYRLIMQAGDGNLALYGPDGPEWSAGSAGTPSHTVLQGDGNLVVYGPAGATWSSRTAGSGAVRLVMQDDGNAVLYSATAAVWSTRGGLVPPPARDTLAVDQRLGPDEALWSADGRYRLVMQAGDGNLVLYGPGGPEWASGSRGTPSYTVMQGDGNLVVYGPAGPTWSSGTSGSGAVRLVLQNDGNAVLYTQDLRAVWASRDAGLGGAAPEWLPLLGSFGNAVGCTYDNGCAGGYHGYPAIDFMVPFGTEVRAAGAGTATSYGGCDPRDSKGCGSGFGNYVVVAHANGQRSYYAHLSELAFSGSTSVRAGQLLGRVGNSGTSYGAHLHYEERNGTATSTRTEPGRMLALHSGTLASYPQALGAYATWNQVPCGAQGDEPGCGARHTVRNDGYR